jgi:lysophospholipase L1-like esterase
MAATFAIALTSLSACAGGARDEGPRASPVPPLQPISKGDEYVAIGDSYTAAPGTGPVAADDGCEQSTTNYPHQVAERLGLRLTDVSCGAATTEQVAAAQILPAGKERPPQADALSRRTDLVTISIGGNDFGAFNAVVTFCTAFRARNPAGDPCSEADAAAGDNSLAKHVTQIQRRLIRLIQLVADRAPRARIFVVGYPQFFPENGPCEELPRAAGDFAYARRVNELLVRAQQQAAAKTNVGYIDVFKATEGHDMCADEPWIAGGSPTRRDALIYHPYPEEQRVVADLLVKRLD